VFPVPAAARGALSGAVYEGPWKNDSPNGHGSFKFSSGAEYEGDFVDGAFHGWGACIFTCARAHCLCREAGLCFGSGVAHVGVRCRESTAKGPLTPPVNP